MPIHATFNGTVTGASDFNTSVLADFPVGTGASFDVVFDNGNLGPTFPTTFTVANVSGTVHLGSLEWTLDSGGIASFQFESSGTVDWYDIKLRDAVAVFSQSQLHCLGLSLFLARAIDSGAGFVVLDDPVLTSDDDFRPNFASSVIEALLDADVQVIVITQDHKSWKDIGHRWEHRGAAQFQIVRENPVSGSEIRGQGDALATMLAQARPFINSQDSEQRKEGATRLRRIIERFCKELIVKSRYANGDAMASITDYDGKAYGDFSALALALLTLDPSHRGKLNAAYGYVTPGPHDDTPPSTAQLKVAAGDLNRLKKDYLP